MTFPKITADPNLTQPPNVSVEHFDEESLGKPQAVEIVGVGLHGEEGTKGYRLSILYKQIDGDMGAPIAYFLINNKALSPLLNCLKLTELEDPDSLVGAQLQCVFGKRQTGFYHIMKYFDIEHKFEDLTDIPF